MLLTTRQLAERTGLRRSLLDRWRRVGLLDDYIVNPDTHPGTGHTLLWLPEVVDELADLQQARRDCPTCGWKVDCEGV